MKKVLLVCVCTIAMAFGATQTHRITLFQPSLVNGTELKAGDYKLEVIDDSRIVISHGKHRVEANVKVESADSKFGSTTVRYQNGDGKYRLQEIRLGGTKTKLVLN